MRKTLLFIFVITIVMLMGSCHKKDIQTSTMPHDFAIFFSYGINERQMNILDTYRGCIQKDLIEDGIATDDYKISDSDLKKIYTKLVNCKIYDIKKNMTSENLSTKDDQIYISPLTKYIINFTIDGKDYNVTGDSTALPYSKNEEVNNYCSFITFMTQYIQSTKEFQALPKPKGGYD